MNRIIFDAQTLHRAKQFLFETLFGSQLDSVTFHGLYLTIAFYRPNPRNQDPSSFFLSTNNSIFVGNPNNLCSSNIGDAEDTIATRKVHSQALVELIGQEVTGAIVREENGALEITCSDSSILVLRNDDEFEEVWDLMSCSANPNDPHDWRMTLTDTSELVIDCPRL